MLDVHVQIHDLVSNEAFSRYLLYWRIGAGVAKDERGHCSEAILNRATTRVVRSPRIKFQRGGGCTTRTIWITFTGSYDTVPYL